MAEQDDVLSREVVIAAKLEENGVALRAKSRAVAALDRLAGSIFDMPAAFFEGVSRKKRVKDEIYERLKLAQAQIAERQVEGMPELGAVLINDVLEDRARKLANAAGVAAEAIDVIKALPPPDPSSTSSATEESIEGEIDEDWMNQFVRFAEDASSERLQQVWGRVLAGEIRKPGSFSRHTLRFIAELDRETAENCQTLAKQVVRTWILKSEKWNEGQNYLVSIDLQRLGIIEGVGVGGPQQNFTIKTDGYAGLGGTSWGLIVCGVPETKLAFPVFMLTRMGQEVMSLLNAADEVQSLREIADQLDKSGLQWIELGPAVRLPNGQMTFSGERQRIWKAADVAQ